MDRDMMSFVFHIVMVVMAVPIVAIVMGIGAGIIKMILKHQERKAEIRDQSLRGGNNSLRAEIEALREELSRLRDTATQFDISIQHTLEELHTRVATLESQRRQNSIPARTAQENEKQAVLIQPGS